MRKLLATATAAMAVLLLAACSEAPKTSATEIKTKTEAAPKEPPSPAGPVPAKTAFYEMYKPARAWAPDFALLSMASKELPGIPSEGGKFGMWTGVFVSPSRGEARTYTYSVVDSGAAIHKGVDDEGGQAWSGPTAASRPLKEKKFGLNSIKATHTWLTKINTAER